MRRALCSGVQGKFEGEIDLSCKSARLMLAQVLRLRLRERLKFRLRPQPQLESALTSFCESLEDVFVNLETDLCIKLLILN